MTSRAEPEPWARLGCTPSSWLPKMSIGNLGEGWASREGACPDGTAPTSGFLHSHPTRAELLPYSQMPLFPSLTPGPPRTKKRCRHWHNQGWDPGQETGGHGGVGLTPPLLKVGSTWRCLGDREAHSPPCRGRGSRRRPLLLAGSHLPPGLLQNEKWGRRKWEAKAEDKREAPKWFLGPPQPQVPLSHSPSPHLPLPLPRWAGARKRLLQVRGGRWCPARCLWRKPVPDLHPPA